MQGFSLGQFQNNYRIFVYSEILPKLLDHIISWLQVDNDFISFWISSSKTNKTKDLYQFYWPPKDSELEQRLKDFILNDKININSSNSVIIDQDPKVAVRNSSNWVPVLKYKGLSNDSTLLYLVKYLLELCTFENISTKITNDFKFGILKINIADFNIS